MDKPVFRNFNSREERIAAFRRMIHLREEWLAHVIQREKELGIYDEGYLFQDAAFYADQVDKEMDQLWESGEWNEQKLQSLRGSHFRTPYHV